MDKKHARALSLTCSLVRPADNPESKGKRQELKTETEARREPGKRAACIRTHSHTRTYGIYM